MTSSIFPDETLVSKIIIVRWHKVMLDKDLAQLFWVPTKALKQAVNRNTDRFPEDFMLSLTKSEADFLRSQIVTLNKGRWQHVKFLPMAFTEHGILMLSNVLKSQTALQVSIQIIRVFNRMRKILQDNEFFYEKLHSIEQQLGEYDERINEFRYTIKQMLIEEEAPERTIGFHVNDN